MICELSVDDYYCELFLLECKRAYSEYLRLCSLFKDCCWYSFVAPGAGQAASAHREVRGVLAPDEGHSQQVDGHPDSHIAQHPDGRFAMNTAASSEHSLNANVKHHMQELGLMGVRTDARTLQTVDVGRSWAETQTTGRLLNNREQRLGSSNDTEAMVKIAQHERSRRMSFLSLGTEWSGYQLGVAALALYVMFR